MWFGRRIHMVTLVADFEEIKQILMSFREEMIFKH